MQCCCCCCCCCCGVRRPRRKFRISSGVTGRVAARPIAARAHGRPAAFHLSAVGRRACARRYQQHFSAAFVTVFFSVSLRACAFSVHSCFLLASEIVTAAKPFDIALFRRRVRPHGHHVSQLSGRWRTTPRDGQGGRRPLNSNGVFRLPPPPPPPPARAFVPVFISGLRAAPR